LIPWRGELARWAARRRFWLWLGAALLAIKAIFLLSDHQPLFIIGDSMSYVGAAFGGVPGDRSFVYGRDFIHPILRLVRSLDGVVVAQAVLSAGSGLMMAVVLRIGLRADRWIAAVAALLYAVEPLALLYERMMTPECLTLFFLALFLLVGVLYVRAPRVQHLVWLAMLSTACVAMRTGVVPVLLGLAAMLPPLGLLRRWPVPRADLGRCALHLAVGLGLTLGMHGLYKQWFHKLTGQPAAYNSADGLFLLASWAPLVTRADFPDPALYDRIRPALGYDLSDRSARPGQRFRPDGLISRLVETQPDEQAANRLARQIAVNAAMRNPVGVLVLGWQTYLDFWNPNLMAHVIWVDEGQQEADQQMIDTFRSMYGEDISGRQHARTFAKSWHTKAALWYRLVLLTPFVWLVALAVLPRCWRVLLLLGASGIGLLSVDCLLVTEPVVRYLHSVAWVTVLLLGVVVQGMRERGGRALRRAGPGDATHANSAIGL
jgi:hypothetical protein